MSSTSDSNDISENPPLNREEDEEKDEDEVDGIANLPPIQGNANRLLNQNLQPPTDNETEESAILGSLAAFGPLRQIPASPQQVQAVAQYGPTIGPAFGNDGNRGREAVHHQQYAVVPQAQPTRAPVVKSHQNTPAIQAGPQSRAISAAAPITQRPLRNKMPPIQNKHAVSKCEFCHTRLISASGHELISHIYKHDRSVGGYQCLTCNDHFHILNLHLNGTRAGTRKGTLREHIQTTHGGGGYLCKGKAALADIWGAARIKYFPHEEVKIANYLEGQLDGPFEKAFGPP